MFKDIKVGDKVLRVTMVSEGFNSGNSFFVPALVTKTTATRLEVGGRTYTKRRARVWRIRVFIIFTFAIFKRSGSIRRLS